MSQVWLKTYAGAADTSQNSLLGLSVDRSSHPHLILNFNQILKAHIIFVQLKKSQGGLQPKHLLLTSRGFQPGFFSEQASAENGFLQSFKNVGLPWAAMAWRFVGNYAFFAFYFFAFHLSFPLCLTAFLWWHLFSSLLLPPNLLTSEVPTLTLTGTLTPMVNSILESGNPRLLKELLCPKPQ